MPSLAPSRGDALRATRLAAVGGISLIALLAAAPAASAHVTIPDPGEKGGFSIVTFSVPNERPDAGTTTVVVQLPPDSPAPVRVGAAEAGLDGRDRDANARRAGGRLRRGGHRGRGHGDLERRSDRPGRVRHVLPVGRPAPRRRRRAGVRRRSRPTAAARRSRGSRPRRRAARSPSTRRPSFASWHPRRAVTPTARPPRRPPRATDDEAASADDESEDDDGTDAMAVAALVLGAHRGAARRRSLRHRSAPDTLRLQQQRPRGDSNTRHTV